MKRLILVLMLVVLAGVAGIVRSRTRSAASLSEWPKAIAGESASNGDKREDIRKSFELKPGATVAVSGINGGVNIETSDSGIAEVLVERTGRSQESLDRRSVEIESTPTNLEIRGKNGDVGLIARLFGSSPTEHVTLKLPRQISLLTERINGGVVVGEVDGPIEVRGINGKVEIAETGDAVGLHGINGNIVVGLKEIAQDRVTLHGVNGNIEFRIAPGLSAEFQAHGMNGNMFSDLPDFVLERARHGTFTGHLGSGGNSITANGINGNILVSRSVSGSKSMNAATGQ